MYENSNVEVLPNDTFHELCAEKLDILPPLLFINFARDIVPDIPLHNYLSHAQENHPLSSLWTRSTE